MKIEHEQLYHDMMTVITKCREINGPEMVENCFWISCKYWEVLKKNTDRKFFDDENKAINFFKTIKPRFTSQIQYYTILAEVLLFVPEDTEEQIIYWKDELKRYHRFCERNEKFVAYYETECVHMDHVYFVRVASDWIPVQQPTSYDSDKNFCSSHDHLVRGLVANKMYYEFVKEKLREVEVLR